MKWRSRSEAVAGFVMPLRSQLGTAALHLAMKLAGEKGVW